MIVCSFCLGSFSFIREPGSFMINFSGRIFNLGFFFSVLFLSLLFFSANSFFCFRVSSFAFCFSSFSFCFATSLALAFSSLCLAFSSAVCFFFIVLFFGEPLRISARIARIVFGEGRSDFGAISSSLLGGLIIMGGEFGAATTARPSVLSSGVL